MSQGFIGTQTVQIGQISAGTSSQVIDTIVLSDSNGISFGLSNGTITASLAALTSQSNQAISGSNGSFTFQTVSFGNLNGLSHYTSNGSLVGSYTVPSIAGLISAINISGGTTSENLTKIEFIDSNGISFGLNGSSITGSHNGLTSQSNQAVSGANGSFTFQTLSLANSNGISFSTGTQGLYATVKTDYLTTAMASNRGSDFVQATAIFAGTNASGTIASDGISVSVNAQSSVDQKVSLYGLGNTTQNSSTVLSVNSLSINAIGSLTVGFSNGSIQLSAPNALTTARASNDAIGLNTAKTNVTWTVNSAGLSFDAAGYAGTGITTATTAGIVLVGTNNTAGLSLGIPAFLTTAMQSNATTISNIRISAGTTSNLLSALTFADSNGIAFGINASTITASYTVPLVTNSSFSIQDSATTLNPVARIAFSTGNNITLSLSTGASSVTVGVQHNLAGTSTGFGGNLISASITHNSSGLNLSLNHPSWLTTAALSGDTTKYIQNWKLTGNTSGTTSSAQGTDLWFQGGNSITISGSSNSIVFSIGNYITTARASTDAIGLNTAKTNVTWTVNSSGISFDAGNYAGVGTSATNASITLNSNGLAISVANPAAGGGATVNGSTGNVSLTVASSLSFSSNGSTISFGLATDITTALQSAGAYLTTAAQSTQTNRFSLSGNSATTNSSIVSAGAYAFAGGNGVTLQMSNNTLSWSVATNYQSQGAYLTTAASAITYSGMDPYRNVILAANAGSNGIATVDNLTFNNVQFDRILIPITNSNATNSSGSHTLNFAIGIYTRNASTLSLITSVSTSTGITHSGTAGSYSLYSGIRVMTVGLTTTLTEGNYFIAGISSTSSAGANGSYGNLVPGNILSNWAGFFGSVQANSVQTVIGVGYVSFTTINLPSSIRLTSISGGPASYALRPIAFAFASSTI